jgi:hypothetical protein
MFAHRYPCKIQPSGKLTIKLQVRQVQSSIPESNPKVPLRHSRSPQRYRTTVSSGEIFSGIGE